MILQSGCVTGHNTHTVVQVVHCKTLEGAIHCVVFVNMHVSYDNFLGNGSKVF